jgi:predicted TIM-barrel fold metal-dependent hydrolase
MRIIDTHQHLIDPDRFHYSWCKGLPVLEEGKWRLEEYWQTACGTGIDQTVFLEADVDESGMQAEAAYFCEVASRPESRMLGVIAACRPERSDFAAYLDSIQHPRLKGLRRILHTQADDLARSSVFGENLARLGALNLTFDLCLLPRQLPVAFGLLNRAPNVQFVLDHCGIPNIKDGEFEPWSTYVRELANYPNLACKISGLVAYCDPKRVTVEAVRPVVEHCVDCFGWDRILFGGDWPVCNLTLSLGDWVAMARRMVQGESLDRQQRFFASNAERVYRLKA